MTKTKSIPIDDPTEAAWAILRIYSPEDLLVLAQIVDNVARAFLQAEEEGLIERAGVDAWRSLVNDGPDRE